MSSASFFQYIYIYSVFILPCEVNRGHNGNSFPYIHKPTTLTKDNPQASQHLLAFHKKKKNNKNKR